MEELGEWLNAGRMLALDNRRRMVSPSDMSRVDCETKNCMLALVWERRKDIEIGLLMVGVVVVGGGGGNWQGNVAERIGGRLGPLPQLATPVSHDYLN